MGFFTCSLASIKFVKKNTVAMQRLKVNCYFLAENRQKVISSWHCSQKHFSLVCWSGYLSITVNQKKWNLCFFTDKWELVTNRTLCRYVSENNKFYAILDSWKLKMFQWIISRNDLGFYQICKAFYTEKQMLNDLSGSGLKYQQGCR